MKFPGWFKRERRAARIKRAEPDRQNPADAGRFGPSDQQRAEHDRFIRQAFADAADAVDIGLSDALDTSQARLILAPILHPEEFRTDPVDLLRLQLRRWKAGQISQDQMRAEAARLIAEYPEIEEQRATPEDVAFALGYGTLPVAGSPIRAFTADREPARLVPSLRPRGQA